MYLAAEWGAGQVLWSIFWFFLFVLWIWLVITVFADIIGSDMSGWGKALWTVGIIFLPYLGVFLYIIVEGNNMSRRAAEQAQAREEGLQDYIKGVAGQPKSPSDELADLAALHSSGAISDREYEQAKSNVIGGS